MNPYNPVVVDRLAFVGRELSSQDIQESRRPSSRPHEGVLGIYLNMSDPFKSLSYLQASHSESVQVRETFNEVYMGHVLEYLEGLDLYITHQQIQPSIYIYILIHVVLRVRRDMVASFHKSRATVGPKQSRLLIAIGKATKRILIS